MNVKIEKQNIQPICPFCEERLEKLIEVKQGWFAFNRVYCCPSCHKIVGMAAGAT